MIPLLTNVPHTTINKRNRQFTKYLIGSSIISKLMLLNVNINDSIIKSINSQNLLDIDSNFAFEKHINSLCRKSSQKLHELS